MYIELTNPYTQDTQTCHNVVKVVFHFPDGDQIFTNADMFAVTSYTSLSVILIDSEFHFNSDYRVTRLR